MLSGGLPHKHKHMGWFVLGCATTVTAQHLPSEGVA